MILLAIVLQGHAVLVQEQVYISLYIDTINIREYSGSDGVSVSPIDHSIAAYDRKLDPSVLLTQPDQ